MSLLKAALRENQFVCVMEFVPKPSAERFAAMEAIMARGQLCGWPMTIAIGDRVGSSLDMSPLDALASFNTPLPALPHFSGKDRERHHLLAQLQRMDAAGLDQLLLLTGDRLPGHQPGQRPVRYLESVAALLIARQACPNWLLGAALNPFKYHEEEGGAQYFKAEKKLAAGADFLTLQLGFDASKHQEAMHWMQRQAAPKPMLACLMSLTHGRATMLEQVAGVTVTPSMRNLLEAESKVSTAFALARSVDRLALQIIGVKLMGYAGVHLSGIHELKQLLALEAHLEHWQAEIHSLDHWAPAWADSWQMPGLPIVAFHPPQDNWRQGESIVMASAKEKARYHLLHGAHSLLFSRANWLSKAFGWAVRQPLWASPRGARVLHGLERAVKRPLTGCDTCGRCRLEDTLYTCPETCPKGLANGPCGGTTLNRCEFGDRECIHSVKYRTAKAVGQTAVLTERLIPCIEVETRHRSSWPQWFEAQPPRQLSPQPAPRTQPES
ncbi:MULTISPECIES: methylenetetrahydrofolate reductase C-terminal domain-containing protein [Pseudomonas]|jgi:methylenetetrahydrofolate reductase (NADPH)|uniref:methylenetetrahydrofolate reductase C-terminal domain-containing protein n=1 Tax=Pseudomonas TaxID=286 RepID=UPI0020C36E17|nr:methylenetetrahydrofolate reductase C-terminal domain-containing protein [Pseudomonas fluorescens]UTL90340.1 methylenetetrahydrofolate reductase C-terminal domain-containing protein [Pseudomonas fluorescens]